MTRAGPLTGLRVLDMATVVAAPFGATLCCDAGAEVVKLELPEGNDALRGLAPTELYWKVLNRGKRGISLDVRQPEGREIFLKLIADFDVLVENFRPGTLDKWGLDWDTLQRHNPKLSVVRLTGFGQTGPYAGRPGFARIFEAMSGLANLTGEAGGAPLHINFPLGDSIAGLFAAFAIASLAHERALCPDAPGRDVDLCATEALLRVLEPLAAEYEFQDVVRSRAGARATYTAPSNIYSTLDEQWFTLVGSSDAIFRRLCVAMEMPELAADARFKTNPDRVRHLEALDARIAQWSAKQDFAQLSACLERNAVPFSKIYSIADVIEDPHFVSRQAIIRLPDPELGSVPAPAAVPRFGGVASAAPRTGPSTGEHNAAIFGALGLTEAALVHLREARVI